MAVHHYPIEVRSHEIDFLGHVNNAVYLNYTEQARMAWLRENGWDLVRMNQEGASHTIVVAGLEMSFKKPCFFGDRLDVRTTVTRIGRSSFELRQDIVKEGDDRPALETTIVGVFITSARKPARITPELRSLLETLLES